METTLTELFPKRLYPPRPPLPPSRAMIDALDRIPPLTLRPPAPRVPERPAALPPAELPAPSEVKPAKLPFRFEFRKGYYSIYTTQGDRFILREEHLAELRRLTTEYNRYNLNRTTKSEGNFRLEAHHPAYVRLQQK